MQDGNPAIDAAAGAGCQESLPRSGETPEAIIP
jgi:hypothetical protein